MKTKTILGLIFLCLVLLGLAGVIVWGVRAYRSPLGPALQATPTPIPVSDPQIVPTVVPTLALAPAAVQAPSCGETAVWNVLVLGSDAADMRGDKGTDLIRIMRVDFSNKKVTVYAFPRQLWVDATGIGLSNPSVVATQLGTVFYEAHNRSTGTNRDAMIAGTNATAFTLSQNFLIGTDHYVTIDLRQLPTMIDEVGGIPVNVPVTTTDPWIGMVIPAGQQTLNGEQFVAYARAKPDSDFGRIGRNNLLLNALRDKALDPVVWGKIPQLYTQFNEVVATDLSPEQINHLACLLKEVPSDAIVQDQVREEWTSPGPQPGSLAWQRTNILDQLKSLGLIP